MFVTHFFFVHNAWVVYNLRGTAIQFGFQLLRLTGLRNKHPERARSGSTPMGWSTCSTYKQAGPPFHTSCITDLHRHKNILPPVVTTAMAAAKFVVKYIQYIHAYLTFQFCVALCYQYKEVVCLESMKIPTVLVKYIFFVLKIYYQIKGAS